MKKFFGIAIICIFIIGAIYYFYENSFVPYHPMQLSARTREGYFIDDKLMSEDHKLAVMAILKSYGYEYRMKGNVLMIKRKLSGDISLIANFTDKAEGLRTNPSCDSVGAKCLSEIKQSMQSQNFSGGNNNPSQPELPNDNLEDKKTTGK